MNYEVVHVHNDIPWFYQYEIVSMYSQSEMENNSLP